MNISHSTSSNKWTSPIFLLPLSNVSQQVLTNEQLAPTFLPYVSQQVLTNEQLAHTFWPYISQRVLTNEHLTFSFTKRQLASSNKWTSCIFLLLLPSVKWQVLTNERLATTLYQIQSDKFQQTNNPQSSFCFLTSVIPSCLVKRCH